MSRHHKLSQLCLYIGILMALIALDWFYYVQHNPEGRFVAAFAPGSVLFVLYLAVLALCFALSFYFGWKARPKHTGRGVKHARAKRG